MKKPISEHSIGVELVSSMGETTARPERDTPLKICVLGDFSGRASRGVVEPAGNRRVMSVDRDDIDDVLKKMNVRLCLEAAGTSVTIEFACLEDFHPDALFTSTGLFSELKDIRDKLHDSRTFNAARAQLQGLIDDPATRPAAKRPQETSPPKDGGNLLDEIIGEAAVSPAPREGRTSLPDMDSFLRAIVKPHLTPGEDPEQVRITALLDTAISGFMAEVMHQEMFQALESSWRGVQFLCSRIETDETLQIFLLDITADELAKDLSTHDDPNRSAVYRLLAGGASDSPWSLIIGNYTFAHGDAATLGRMARVACAAGAPFIAHADPGLVGCRDLGGSPNPASWSAFPDRESLAAWTGLRHQAEAVYLGLAMPRFLLRLPYGPDTEPIEGFDFEEMAGDPVHEHYLWGNPAFA
ncbi:MAG: type VI secretion system contractile sheath large subunit, partial [Desulfomonilia bacterium]|nr:type VI secretion system contractile sheath large subunit [Desulfomonilia bacterium]